MRLKPGIQLSPTVFMWGQVQLDEIIAEIQGGSLAGHQPPDGSWWADLYEVLTRQWDSPPPYQ